ncbi:hypothetical protein V5799_008982 [Amblyomma americanum]|uniref:Uncharacterized protein n=1 Tax=Amblyomma americanum TaxID=6943 RepID=A0AAQ4FD42_AMBAM
MVNLTLNPCQEPFHYVCYHWEHQSADSTLSSAVKDAFASVIQGTDQSDPGRTLNRIYTSCISAVASTEPTENILVRGILEDVSSFVVAPYRFHNNLLLILTLSLTYSAFSPVHTNAERTGEKYRLGFWPENSSVIEFLSEGDEGAKREVLERLLVALNKEGTFHLSMTDVSNIASDISHSGKVEPEVIGNLSLLEQFVPQGAPSTFRSVLDKIYTFPANSTTVILQFPHLVRKILRFFADPANQPTAISYAIFEAAVLLMKQLLSVENFKPAQQFEECVRYLRNFRILLFALYARKLSNPVKDRLVLATAEDIKAVVIEKVSLLGDAGDKVKVSNTISELRVVVPSYVARLIKDLPDVSSNLFSNYLRNSAWTLRLQLSRFNARLGVTDIMNRKPYEEYVLVTRGHLFIAPVVLGWVATTNPEARFERSAAVGPVVADALWKLVLDNTTWSATAEKKLGILRKCASKKASSYRYPVLSLQTAAWTARDSTWNTPRLVWSLWEASISQVFYLRYIHFVACLRVIAGIESEDQAVADVAFVAATPDFRKAFNCSLPVENNGTCAQEIEGLE